jgi:hypothetical protein
MRRNRRFDRRNEPSIAQLEFGFTRAVPQTADLILLTELLTLARLRLSHLHYKENPNNGPTAHNDRRTSKVNGD